MTTVGIPIFGVGSLHHLATSSRRLNLLRQALDLGFRAFDVAPAYGNGLNEVELGRALSGIKDEVRVSTKFGIPVDLFGERLPALAYPIRVFQRMWNARTYGSAYERRIFTLAEMERSLEGSLRRLRRDWVDDFLIHEPLDIIPPAELEALGDAAERLKAQGKIRRWGVAGPAHSIASMIKDRRIDVVQAPLLDFGSLGRMTKKRIAYGTYKAYQMCPEAKQAGFISFAKDRMRSVGADLIVSTRNRQTLARFQDLFH